MKWLLTSAMMVYILSQSPVLAMEFSIDGNAGQERLIVATGEIVPGDDAKLHRFVAGLPTIMKLIGIVLTSPGGNYLEGVNLATTIRNTGLSTVVPADGRCASACFVMFAAGRNRLMFERARVGVHSASSSSGQETVGSEAVTTLMARKASELGVPSSVIGKMVTTPPDRMTWLDENDLDAMRVSQVNSTEASYQPGIALKPGTGVSASPTTTGSGPKPSDTTEAIAPVPSVVFQQGAHDRTQWQAWFGALDGEAKLGADWWAANRGAAARSHLSCSSIGSSADFAQGCRQAQALLAPVKSSPLRRS